MSVPSILVINPGSTSDEIALFRGAEKVFHKVVRYQISELSPFEGQKVTAQYEFRRQLVLKTLAEKGIELSTLTAIAGRGGLVRPIPSGTYKITENLLRDLREGVLGDHPSNLGGLIAQSIAEPLGIPAFIADPVVVDELSALARYSGMPENPRMSIFHALNQKRVARIIADKIGKKYEDCNFIVAHAGGGCSVGAHQKGRVVDVNNALDGEGPFSPQRAGSLPAGGLVRMCFSGNYTLDQMKAMLKGRGGAVAYAGTSDMIILEKFADGVELSPEQRSQLKPGFTAQMAQEVLDAMAYQVAKEIGAMATALSGKVDAIILTGGQAYGKKHYVEPLRARVEWIAPVEVIPGGDEMSALQEAAMRVLSGAEKPLEY